MVFALCHAARVVAAHRRLCGWLLAEVAVFLAKSCNNAGKKLATLQLVVTPTSGSDSREVASTHHCLEIGRRARSGGGVRAGWRRWAARNSAKPRMRDGVAVRSIECTRLVFDRPCELFVASDCIKDSHPTVVLFRRSVVIGRA